MVHGVALTHGGGELDRAILSPMPTVTCGLAPKQCLTVA